MVTLATCRRVTFSSLSRIAPACGFIPRRWERWLLRKQRARVGQREQEQPPFLSKCQGLWTRMAYMTIGIFSNLRFHASEILSHLILFHLLFYFLFHILEFLFVFIIPLRAVIYWAIYHGPEYTDSFICIIFIFMITIKEDTMIFILWRRSQNSKSLSNLIRSQSLDVARIWLESTL